MGSGQENAVLQHHFCALSCRMTARATSSPKSMQSADDLRSVTLVVTLAGVHFVTLALSARTRIEGVKVEEVEDPPDSSSHGDSGRRAALSRAKLKHRPGRFR